MTDFTPAERAALDRATVPAMRPGLAADILAAASGRAPARRGSRGGWRHGRVLIGVGALLAASATAAATGLLDRLPIRIPGVTHSVAAPAPVKPKLAHLRPRADIGAVAIAVPLPSPTPTVAPNWQRQQRRRAALIAAGLPPALARRPMIARALAEQAGGPRADRGAAVVAEWRRLRAMPPAERKAAIVKIRADFLARHPRLAQRYEQRLEARSIAAAGGEVTGVAEAAPPQAAADRRAWRQQRMARRALRARDDTATPASDATPPPQR